jgi:N4-gp56 family major capsid protein
MAEYNWEQDEPSGPLKNHSLSSDIREAAIAATKLLPFADPEPGYGAGKGETHNITRIRNIAEPADPTFTERERVPIDKFELSTNAITVKYFGRGIGFTEKAQLLNHFDLKDKIQRKLRQQMQLALDSACATALKSGKVKFIPTTLSGGVFDTDGTPSTTALVNVTVSHLKVLRDYAMDTLHIPGWAGGEELIGCFSTKALRGVRNDPEFVESAKYTSREYMMTGEIGKVENIRLIEINHTNALANNKGSGGVLGEGVVFGEDAVSIVTAMDPELRAEVPANFGLSRAVAWVGLLNFGQPWGDSNADGEARVLHVTSQ